MTEQIKCSGSVIARALLRPVHVAGPFSGRLSGNRSSRPFLHARKPNPDQKDGKETQPGRRPEPKQNSFVSFAVFVVPLLWLVETRDPRKTPKTRKQETNG